MTFVVWAQILCSQTEVSFFEYRLSAGLNSNSETSDDTDSGLEYAGLGWHIRNTFYLGRIHRPKFCIALEQTKSVTNLENRFALSPTNSDDVDPKAINTSFLKLGGGGQFLVKYTSIVLLYAEASLNYNILLQRDIDRILEQEKSVYDLDNHWDLELGFIARRKHFSIGLMYARNLSNISDNIESLNKNVVSLDLGYTF